MPEITIIKDGEEKLINVKPLTNRQVDELMAKEVQLNKEVQEDEDFAAVQRYKDYQYDLASKQTLIPIEEIRDMDAEQYEKIKAVFEGVVNRSMGFRKP